VAQQVVHFEIIGTDPGRLRDYYGTLFGWRFATGGSVAPEVSANGAYGFVEGETIPGGVGGGAGYTPHTVFYVGVDDVPAALEKAEGLGGKRAMGPVRSPDGTLVVAHFTDPEGNLVGLAGPAATS
jgi:predicted enzyme related to lactoylglutathione lyase